MHWHTLALDIKGPFPCGINLLILIDYHSQYPVVTSVVNNKQCQHDLTFRKTFFRKITTENTPELTSSEFKKCLSTHNIEHHMVTPY